METVERLFDGHGIYQHTIKKTRAFSVKIWKLLGSPEEVGEYNCDALWFAFSALPECIKEIIHGDAYLVYGITKTGTFISEWVPEDELCANLDWDSDYIR